MADVLHETKGMVSIPTLFFSRLRFAVRGIFHTRPHIFALCFGLLLFQGCALLQRPPDIAAPPQTSAQPVAKTPPAVPVRLPQTGGASWYGAEHHGKQTASGAIYDQTVLTAAHPSLPFGNKVKVTNLANRKSVVVEITDRGPFSGNRIIDLSQAAAQALEMIESGTASVRLEIP